MDKDKTYLSPHQGSSFILTLIFLPLYAYLFKRTMKPYLPFIFFIITLQASAQNWQFFIDSIPTLSSPRACDLNNDGIQDIVFGGGTDGAFSQNGIMAVNGANGTLLWKRTSRNEVFGSAIFQDITNDGIKDVFIAGRQAQLLAINGANGNLLWDYFPYNLNPGDSGLYNFYNPQFISDVNGDGLMDLLVTNGGDHAAPVWDTNRPPGHLMVINALNGNLLAKAVVPDSAETYCSPLVVDIQGNGVQWVLYGTGGETLGGSFWACPLSALLNNTLSPSIALAQDPNFGFIAPASVYKTNNNQYNIYIQSYSGKLIKIKGSNFTQHWSYDLPNTESSAEPVIGNFTGNNNPDVFLSLAKGSSSGYTDYYQVLLDGATGQEVFKDSIGHLQFASGNAVDLNNDGRDEAVVAVNYMVNGVWKHRLQSFDFVNQTVQEIVPEKSGVNIGSTPLFTNLDGDNSLDLVYLVKRDSTNVMGWKGVFALRAELNVGFPNAGIAWGSYLGTLNDGEYHNTSIDCGPGSLISSVALVNPHCNGANTGSITPSVTLGAPPYTYIWSNGSTSNSLNNITAGTYTLQVTDNAGCYELYTATLNDPYLITFGGVVPPTCPGGSNGQAVVNSSGCPCMFSTCQFLWENGITTKPNSTLTEGWASITITHPDGCVVVDSVLIPSSPSLVDTAIVHSISCYGYNDGSIQVSSNNATPPVSYSWNNGSANDSLMNLSPGVYILNISDARPCFDTLLFTVTEPSEISVSTLTLPTQCYNSQDGGMEIIPAGGNGGYSFFINNQAYSQSPVNGLSSGTYNLFVQDSQGCFSSTTSITIPSPSPISISTSITPESAQNALDGTATVNATGGTPPYLYTWSDPNHQTDSTAIYLSQGWYSVSVLDQNGCSAMDSVFVGILGTPTLEPSAVWAFPNPSKDAFQLNVVLEKAQLFDASGKLVYDASPCKEISSEKVAPGFYYLTYFHQNTVGTLVLIKNE